MTSVENAVLHAYKFLPGPVYNWSLRARGLGKCRALCACSISPVLKAGSDSMQVCTYD